MRTSLFAAGLRSSSSRTLVVAGMLCLVVTVAAAAHDTWLLPASLRVPVGRPVTISLTSGMAFPADDFAINPARIARADVRLAGATSALSRPTHAEQALRYRWRPARAGVATLVVELAPKTLTLAPASIGEYLDEIGASPALRASWAAMPAPKQWRERYVKHAATFIRVGRAAGDSSWVKAMGMGLEIVPLGDPTALRAGDSLRVLVLRAGKPLPGFSIASRPAGRAIARQVTTDSVGGAVVALPGAGRWLLSGTDLRRSSEPELEWESDFATLTIGVAQRGGTAERREW